MKITKDTDEELVIETKPGFIVWVFLGLAFVMFYLLAKTYTEVPRNMHDVYAAGVGVLFMLFGYMVFYEKSVFKFHKISKQLIWSRKRLFKREEGLTSFQNIKSVVLENSMNGDSSPNVRVVVVTEQGKIPLTNAYIGNDSLCIRVAKRIRQILKYPDRDLVIDSINEMIRNGQEIEAIKMLRKEKEISLAEAKEQIDDIKRNQKFAK